MASNESDVATIAKSGTSFSTPFPTGIAVLFHEGAVRYGKVKYEGGDVPGLDPAITGIVTMEQLIDVGLERSCIKPEGSLPGKDNNAGYGLPFGSLMARVLGPPGLEMGSLISSMLAIGMIGMMAKLMDVRPSKTTDEELLAKARHE